MLAQLLHSMSDVKELIPEFLYARILLNADKFPLGIRQDGKTVDDVELPPWAANAHEFIRINSALLKVNMYHSIYICG